MSTPYCVSLRSFVLTATVGLLVMMTACLASGQSSRGLLDDPTGEASYYADKFAGRTTASGDTFDPSEMTAAHPNLPFGTRVRVTRLNGGESVTVRINDRGPYADDRIIDLSEAAARKIGMIDEGVVDVRLEVVSHPSDSRVTSSSRSGGDSNSGGRGW